MRWFALASLVIGFGAVACGGSSSDAPANSSDAGASSDAATEGGSTSDASVGDPITAPNDTWTWIDFPDSKCASGTPTGIAVNPHAGATNLMFYFEGGGSCSTADTCWGPNPGANNVPVTTRRRSPRPRREIIQPSIARMRRARSLR